MLKRNESETIHDFALRLYANKKEYGINSDDIAKLLNAETGMNKGESAWRKKYKSFAAGMQYANEIRDRNISDRILCISDCHVPFQLPISLLEKYRNRTDVIVLNGDICDCQSISSFMKIYRKSPIEEIIETRKYIIDMIEYINPKKVIINYGNHDLRFQNYLAKNLDTDILELMPKTSLELMFIDGFNHYNKEDKTKTYYKPLIDVFSNIEIEYTDNWYAQYKSIIFCHPRAYSNGILKTAEKAMYWFRNEGMNFKTLVMAHTHKSGLYNIGNTTIIEQGAFCDVNKNNYSDGLLHNSQKEGFLYLCLNKNGEVIRDKTELVVLK